MGLAIPGLRALRDAHGWTQAELSARSGLATTTIFFLERGGPIATMRSLTLLARALGVPVAELLRSTTVAPRRPWLHPPRIEHRLHHLAVDAADDDAVIAPLRPHDAARVPAALRPATPTEVPA